MTVERSHWGFHGRGYGDAKKLWSWTPSGSLDGEEFRYITFATKIVSFTSCGAIHCLIFSFCETDLHQHEAYSFVQGIAKSEGQT